MKRRFYSLLLAAALLLGVLAAPQQARAAGLLTISSVSAPRGETVEVTVSLTGDDVCSGNFDLRYPAAELELVASSSLLAFGMVNPVEAGLVRMSFASTAALTDAALCRLTFRVTADTPAGGSVLTAERIRLYDENGQLTTADITAGSVGRDTVALRLSDRVTAAYQAVSMEVELAGALECAGGSFTVTYDPTCFAVKSVLAGEGGAGVSLTYNVVEPGTLRVSFASAERIPACVLCRVVLQTVTAQERVSAVELIDARVYDENSQPLDVSVGSGSVAITAPSDRDPKLWVVGGQLREDGTAEAAVVLQGRDAVCGGNFTLTLDSGIEVQVTDSASGVTWSRTDAGLSVAWGSAFPYGGETTLLKLRLSGGEHGSRLGFDGVRLYDRDSTAVPVVDVRPAALQRGDAVTAVIDELLAEPVSGGQTAYTLAVDVASAALDGETVETVAPVLALYDADNRLVALQTVSESLRTGVGELTLTAKAAEPVAEVRVFLLSGDGGSFAPLCAALAGSLPAA